ncbi:MAG: type II toxin-antitoxin system RelE/ParE family toxin [Ruminococcus sp.]|nr:type II toxin-antitoxin system RelE/ParE family toxin [Ruminococcus sp.]
MATPYKKIFSPEFNDALDRISDYIGYNLYSPKAAANLACEIDKRIVLASENPYMYPVCHELPQPGDTRKIAVKNFIILYSVNEEEKAVVFLNLFHGKQDYIAYFNN